MNILHVSPRYFPAISGAEFYMQRLSEILQTHFDIGMHCSDALDFRGLRNATGKRVPKNRNTDRINNIQVNRHPVDQEPDAILAEREEYARFFKQEGLLADGSALDAGPISADMRHALLDAPADLIHATCFPYANVFTALLAAKRRGIPAIVTPFYHAENPRYDVPWASALGSFDRVLSCSRAESRALVDHGVPAGRIFKITMGVDADRFQVASSDVFTRVTGLDPSRDDIVLFCGFKNYEKGAITVLHAIPQVLDRLPSARFVMIGPPSAQYNFECRKIGPARKAVVNLNPENLSGYFDPIKLGAFKACRVYAMPSRSEAFGIAYLEAWACGKPVVASSIPAMQELFEDGNGGLHVPFDDSEALATTIVNLLDDPGTCEQMGARGREKIDQEGLTWDGVAVRVRGIYEDILG